MLTNRVGKKFASLKGYISTKMQSKPSARSREELSTSSSKTTKVCYSYHVVLCGLFTYYIITKGEGGSLQMITLHVIVSNTTTVRLRVITEEDGGGGGGV